MKVLCLWYQPPDSRPAPFINPMIRSAKAFSRCGIDLEVHRVATGSEADTSLNGDYDVLLLHEAPLYRNALDIARVRDRPVIFLERLDGAQLRRCRKYLDRIAGVIKGYTFRHRHDYNLFYDRRHIETMHDAGIKCLKPIYCGDPPEPVLLQSERDKIRTGYGFGAWDNIGQLVDRPIDFDAERPIDVQFAGTVSYEESEVEAHRLAALHAVQAWGGVQSGIGGRPMSYKQYTREVSRSKAVLCPWGWGESTHRDYEAWMLGAVVVKPNTDYVESWPDVYRAGETYVECAPDFSDAHELIAHIVDHFDEYKEMRKYARALVFSHYRADVIAKHMAKQIRSLVK